eukprot:NODE_43_length_28809_cov_0.237200.p6 type:complete len:520 gc:universal NODE_43_length_28809_cov_0.237200:11081-12640(+)
MSPAITLLQKSLYRSRPPICCILGHVDHGKSTLMDYLKKHEISNKITENEFGGITQHVGSFEVNLKSSKDRITFLDLPGHSAFEEMRSRGAKGADIGILVIAADDGFKEQSRKALEHIRNSNLPFIVALNKVDKQGCNIAKVKRQLVDNGIELEDFGGDVPCVEISALKGTNIQLLEENIIALAELLELKEEKKSFEALVVESKIKKGVGAVATLIPLSGTLKKGNILFCSQKLSENPIIGKVRSIVGFSGNSLVCAVPCTPVEVSGWRSLPPVGSKVVHVKSESQAKKLFKALQDPTVISGPTVSVDKNGWIQIPVILRCDVAGSLEAVINMVHKLPLYRYKANCNIVSAEVGEITQNEVNLSKELNGALLGFNVRKPLAHSDNIFSSNIIYDLENQFKEWIIKNKLPLQKRETEVGVAKVLQLFDYNKNQPSQKRILGSEIKQGLAKCKSQVQVFRNDKLVLTGILDELKHHKKVIDKIESGKQCGISLSDCDIHDVRVNDELRIIEVALIPANLSK